MRSYLQDHGWPYAFTAAKCYPSMDDFPIALQLKFHFPLTFHSLYTQAPPKTSRPHAVRLHQGKLGQNYLQMTGICRKEWLEPEMRVQGPSPSMTECQHSSVP